MGLIRRATTEEDQPCLIHLHIISLSALGLSMEGSSHRLTGLIWPTVPTTARSNHSTRPLHDRFVSVQNTFGGLCVCRG